MAKYPAKGAIGRSAEVLPQGGRMTFLTIRGPRLLPHDPSIQLNLPLPPGAAQLPKCRAINTRNQAREVDVVKSVEHVSSNLELGFLRQF